MIQRPGNKEKYLVIVKQRPGHICSSADILFCIIMWDGLQESKATKLHIYLTETIDRFQIDTKECCGSNATKTRCCQGKESAWSIYCNSYKFTRSRFVGKSHLYLKSQKQVVNEKLQKLAYWIGRSYRGLVLIAFENQYLHETITMDRRLGYKPKKPFSGCLDCCAHSYKVFTIFMVTCCTVVVTLTKHKKITKRFHKQLHHFLLNVMEFGNEFLSNSTQEEKKQKENVEVLTKYVT